MVFFYFCYLFSWSYSFLNENLLFFMISDSILAYELPFLLSAGKLFLLLTFFLFTELVLTKFFFVGELETGELTKSLSVALDVTAL